MNASDLIPPDVVYHAKQVQELDRLTIAEEQAGIVLMKRAGQAIFSLVRRDWPTAKGLAIFCGSGNNGGDGSTCSESSAVNARDEKAIGT